MGLKKDEWVGKGFWDEWGSGGRWFKSSRPDQVGKTAIGGAARGVKELPPPGQKSSTPAKRLFIPCLSILRSIRKTQGEFETDPSASL
jgi:hypothetical protein